MALAPVVEALGVVGQLGPVREEEPQHGDSTGLDRGSRVAGEHDAIQAVRLPERRQRLGHGGAAGVCFVLLALLDPRGQLSSETRGAVVLTARDHGDAGLGAFHRELGQLAQQATSRRLVADQLPKLGERARLGVRQHGSRQVEGVAVAVRFGDQPSQECLLLSQPIRLSLLDPRARQANGAGDLRCAAAIEIVPGDLSVGIQKHVLWRGDRLRSTEKVTPRRGVDSLVLDAAQPWKARAVLAVAPVVVG